MTAIGILPAVRAVRIRPPDADECAAIARLCEGQALMVDITAGDTIRAIPVRQGLDGWGVFGEGR